MNRCEKLRAVVYMGLILPFCSAERKQTTKLRPVGVFAPWAFALLRLPLFLCRLVVQGRENSFSFQPRNTSTDTHDADENLEPILVVAPQLKRVP